MAMWQDMSTSRCSEIHNPATSSPCSDFHGLSLQALVLLFSAYVDARQGFGPEGLRERLVEALIQRKAELSATLLPGSIPVSACIAIRF